MVPLWLTVPQDRAVYTGLSTDHYPWPEVYADLGARPQLTGVLDAQQGAWRGRCLWLAGSLQGGYLQGEAAQHPLAGPGALGRALPGARVSLTPLEPVTAQLVWACQGRAAQPLPRPWPEARELLVERGLSGALLGERGACSYWQGGRLMGGALPERGERLSAILLGTGSGQGAGDAPLEPAELLAFWSGMLRVLEQALPPAGGTVAGGLEGHWRAVVVALADAHPCLDPFAREVWWTASGGAQAHPDVTLEELRPALLELYRALLRRGGLELRALPLGPLRQQRAWPLSGLQAAVPDAGSQGEESQDPPAGRPLAG